MNVDASVVEETNRIHLWKRLVPLVDIKTKAVTFSLTQNILDYRNYDPSSKMYVLACAMETESYSRRILEPSKSCLTQIARTSNNCTKIS